MKLEVRSHLELIGSQTDALRESSKRITSARDEERRRLARDMHDGLQQHLSSGGTLLFRAEFRLVMADAAAARHEDHRGRHYISEIAGVMAGARGDTAMAVAERFGRRLDRVH